MVIDSAHDDNFDAYYCKSDPFGTTTTSSSESSLLKPYFDGSASWFTWVTLQTSRTSAKAKSKSSKSVTWSRIRAFDIGCR